MSNPSKTVELIAPSNIPLIANGDDLGALICASCKEEGIAIEDGDIVVMASKIVSKAEGRIVSLKTVTPGEKAKEIAAASGKDPRIVELMLRESEAIIEVRKGIVVTFHKLGFICTSAGIDKSNTGKPGDEVVSLLPEDPDTSAAHIRSRILEITSKNVGVLINDSFGIKYRHGSIGMAVGVSGMPAMLVGAKDEKDLYGKERGVGVSLADEASAAASMLMGQSNQGRPVVIIRGLDYPLIEGKLTDIVEAQRVRDDLKKLQTGGVIY